MLQSLSMMQYSDEIDAQLVYDFTGNPSPKMIKGFMDILLTENIEVASIKIGSTLKELGIAL